MNPSLYGTAPRIDQANYQDYSDYVSDCLDAGVDPEPREDY